MIYTVTLNPALDKTVEIPHFAPGRVNRIAALRTDPGGKGLNVSKVIAKLGGDSVAFALLSGSTGRVVADAMERLGVRCHIAWGEGETRTNLKIVDPVGRTNTDINEPGFAVPPALADGLLDRLTAALRPGDVVVLSGSLPLGAPADTYATWITRCKAAGARVFLDADGAALAEGLKAKPFLVKPNDEELSRLMGRKLRGVAALADAARQLVASGVENVVVSMGGAGAIYANADTVLRTEGLSVPVRSTVGAGDSVVAALAFALERGMPLHDAAVLSTAVGAANVMCSGTQAAERSAVDALLPKVICHTI